LAKLILVVEDDVDLATSVAEVLEAEGYSVAIAANGKEGLEQLQTSQHPELILLDMAMPVMDGRQFRATQLKLPALASVPVIVMTADGDAREKAASICATSYLTKPLTVAGLLDEVERVCGSPDA
jgi:CheY-like chemotaxis protein